MPARFGRRRFSASGRQGPPGSDPLLAAPAHGRGWNPAPGRARSR